MSPSGNPSSRLGRSNFEIDVVRVTSLRRLCNAVIRVVPKVDREEFVNAGVIVSCPDLSFPVHTGRCDDPAAALDHLVANVVD
ncbi:MAG TPA: DUF3037 domain-containing protein [Pyrinomonadaceae bacterium]|nr:DUF3037 domain-containing protein [Pyrinomonadaceae bacterium]